MSSRRTLLGATSLLVALSLSAAAGARPGTNPQPNGTGSSFVLSLLGTSNVERSVSTESFTAPGLLFVTHVWNYPVTSLPTPVPVGSNDPRFDNGVYFLRGTNVAWNATPRNFTIRADNGSPIPGNVAFNVHYEPPASTRAFVHRAVGANITRNYTVIDNPLLNGQANLAPQVQAVYGTANAHNVGVFYVNGKWAIYNQDLAAMPAGATFNVLASTLSTAKVTATAANTSSSWVYLSELPTNVRNHPRARLLVTQAWTSVYNNHPVGVWFDRSRGMWAIFNEDRAPIPAGAVFHVDWDFLTVNQP